jgi:GH25 family lysozyme M1 (1,4-beta-N-acetylmuramidase)
MSTFATQQAPAVAYGVDTYDQDNRPIDWAAALAFGISFAIIKASDGYETDSAFATDWKTLGEVGMTRAAYHFLRPSKDANLQAAHFLNVLNSDGVGLLPTDFPVCVDVELNEGKTREEVCECLHTFIDAVESATKRTAMVYTPPGFAEEFLDGTFGAQHLWLADYNPEPVVPAGWSAYLIWQYAAGEGGPGTAVGGPTPMHPTGFPSSVDSNRAFGTHAELLAHLGIGVAS